MDIKNCNEIYLSFYFLNLFNMCLYNTINALGN